jgi:hypothetical protein
MAEVYTNTYAIIDLEVTDSRGNLVDPVGDVTVEVFDYDIYNEQTGSSGAVIDEGVASQTLYGSTPATGRFEYELTPQLTSEPKTLKITWTYTLDPGEGQERSSSKEIFVSVPYATLSRLREIKELNEYSDQEIMAMERLVARVIDSYCGQSFGFELDKVKTVVGDASQYLILPSRLWQLDDVSVLDDYERIIRDNIGNVLDVDISGRSILEYVIVDVDNPWRIRNKRSYNYVTMDETRTKSFFKNGNIYAVRGNWGYPFVPARVTEATLILVKTYFYDDATYRDRYISEISAGSWKMKLTTTGDATTGSANADMILSAYRNINAAVL